MSCECWPCGAGIAGVEAAAAMNAMRGFFPGKSIQAKSEENEQRLNGVLQNDIKGEKRQSNLLCDQGTSTWRHLHAEHTSILLNARAGEQQLQ